MTTKRTFATTALLASIVMVAISGTTQSVYAQVFSQDIPGDADILFVELVDGSSSISGADFTLLQEGLKAGMQTAFDAAESDPQTDLFGEIYIVIIQFSSTAQTECTQEVDDQGDLDTLFTCIDGITQLNGQTCMSCGFDLATTEFGNAPIEFTNDVNDRQIIDLITDGAPFPEDPQDALDAEDAAVAAGYDRVVALGVGASDNAFLSTIVDPNPPGPIDPVIFPDDDGFVITANDFADFEDALVKKLIATGDFDFCDVFPEDPVCNEVGGEFLTVNNSALLIAGLSANLGLIVPIAAGIAGAGALFIRSRMNKD